MKNPLTFVRVAVVALSITASLPSFAAESASTTSTTCPAQININKADATQLSDCLPHIGPKTAEAIVTYRTAHGNFKDVKDIADVKGVGQKRAETLAPKLTVK